MTIDELEQWIREHKANGLSGAIEVVCLQPPMDLHYRRVSARLTGAKRTERCGVVCYDATWREGESVLVLLIE